MITIVGITLGSRSRVYYFLPNNLDLVKEQNVIVETEKGQQFGKVVFERKEVSEQQITGSLKYVLRLATETDEKKYQTNILDAKEALIACRKIADEEKLNMIITSAEYTLNKEQLMFKFLSDNRVDFRELVKKMASKYHTRIDMHQVGIRDKAKEVGGLGMCGLVLCCHKYLNDFDSVTINMAKNQGIALNPSKINGQCGRLLCCLKFEDECYRDCQKNLPKYGSRYMTEKGEGKVVGVDILNKSITVDVPDYGRIKVEVKE